MLAVAGNSWADDVRFNRDIRPILSDNCFQCHGPDAAAREAELRLDIREEAVAALAPGRPEKSAVLERVTAKDEWTVMPPPETHKSVSKAEAELLRRWIADGAEYEPHWSFLKPERIDPLQFGNRNNGDNLQHPIDRFVQARLADKGLAPSPEADRPTLLRRVTLTLTGLPPTPAAVESFVNDPAPTDVAYERVVDRLLASPRYGEHMAYPWLDAARYADSDGYESDPLRNMWPWRDWVVEALNNNKPYDEFAIEQLAGDLLPEATLKQQLATGFNRNHRNNNEGGTIGEEWRIEYVADRAETTATVFLGLTWGCARCHDHKYDPISQADYYRLFAFFNNVPEIGKAFGGRNAPPMLNVSRLEDIEEFEATNEALQPLEEQLTHVNQTDEFETRLIDWFNCLDRKSFANLPDSVVRTPPEDWDKKQIASARKHFLEHVDPAGRLLAAQAIPLRKKRDRLQSTGAKVMVMAEMDKPRETHLLKRGAWDQPGQRVSAKTPDWLPPMKEQWPDNRLGLAKWIVDRDNPLTARVAVNRLWAHHFGSGLVRTMDDFGLQGATPTHPELLDWLAVEFIDTGWNTKAMHRLVVTSHTFRQTSRVTPEQLKLDPENQFLARGPRYRLPAQVIRDQALFAGGLIVEKAGGPPVKPYQPVGLWKEIVKGSPTYKRDDGDALYRRSLYTFWRRAVKPPLMVLLDANERDVCTIGQKRTNTPLQALLMLNDVTFVEAARGLGGRMLKEAGPRDTERAKFAFRAVLGRDPDQGERAILVDALQGFRDRFREEPEAAKKLIAVGESSADSTLEPTELAAQTAIARLIMNLDEAVTFE
ncbi:PSD1 and planctomycete cytochrome C domain-containing protein [Stratiformator vulcanicus]|nr:PSD1 and planctomycete cytochrome C domain-containing protein [Stratiformator vulcanicus]